MGSLTNEDVEMTDIDWSKAPEGAQYYSASDDGFYTFYREIKESTYEIFYCGGTRWVLRAGTPEEHCTIIPRPSPSWNGEGLPPVGIECEVMHGTYGWIGAKVVGRVGSTTVIRTNDGYAGVHPHEIRPIRTPEQIAADEREAAIKAIVGLIESADSRDMTIAEAIYNAGYRKP